MTVVGYTAHPMVFRPLFCIWTGILLAITKAQCNLLV